jgi:Domain of unknown function (DUF4160)
MRPRRTSGVTPGGTWCTVCTGARTALKCLMPTIRRFERCRITMYFKDHAPPHFHVITNSDERVTVIIES